MAAKGTTSKNRIFTKLKEIYSDAFWEDEGKILRIPLDEDGSRIEIKVQLTAAKTNLGGENIPSAFDNSNKNSSKEEESPTFFSAFSNATPQNIMEPTTEEKENVSKLLKSLGF